MFFCFFSFVVVRNFKEHLIDIKAIISNRIIDYHVSGADNFTIKPTILPNTRSTDLLYNETNEEKQLNEENS